MHSWGSSYIAFPGQRRITQRAAINRHDFILHSFSQFPFFLLSSFGPTGSPCLCVFFIFGYCNFLQPASSFSQQQLFQLLPISSPPPPSLAEKDRTIAILAASYQKTLRKHGEAARPASVPSSASQRSVFALWAHMQRQVCNGAGGEGFEDWPWGSLGGTLW